MSIHTLFRRDTPTEDELAAFDRDGFIAFSDILTDSGREALAQEILNREDVRQFLHAIESSPDKQGKVHFVRPWNDRGPVSYSLIDAPLIATLLQQTVGPAVHFCHSSFNVAARGSDALGIHQDHHHWFHNNPVNLAERDRKYIQVLYYPNGFTAGDRSLSVIPGSHRIAPLPGRTPERILAGEFDSEAGRPMELLSLSLPPGSMIYLNARTFHGVAPKPLDSPAPYRIFAIDIFKEAGPPHRFTQEIPAEWWENATPYHKKLYDRDAYTPERWQPS